MGVRARARKSAMNQPTAGQGKGLSETVRQRRLAAKLTLKQLSTLSGLAASTLSKIEHGQISPTYGNILRLANGLGVDVAELFSDRTVVLPLGRRSITRQSEGIRHDTRCYQYELLCADLSQKRMIPLVTRIRARAITDFPDLLKHAGEEFIFVLSGSVEVHTELYEPLSLAEGDSCYFDSSMGHALLSCGTEDAVILWVCSEGGARHAGRYAVPATVLDTLAEE